MLSTKGINILADTLAQGVVDDIYASEQFIDMMHSIVPDLITARLGDCDDDLLFDLSLAVMDRVTLKAVKM